MNGKKWNGKGYNTINEIIYELKNGKGYIKEYDYWGKLKFEGEYLNGLKNGKGNEYDYWGKLIFEGEYLNGKRNGKGKEYYDNGDLKFEGEYLNGIPILGIKHDPFDENNTNNKVKSNQKRNNNNI